MPNHRPLGHHSFGMGCLWFNCNCKTPLVPIVASGRLLETSTVLSTRLCSEHHHTESERLCLLAGARWLRKSSRKEESLDTTLWNPCGRTLSIHLLLYCGNLLSPARMCDSFDRRLSNGVKRIIHTELQKAWESQMTT